MRKHREQPDDVQEDEVPATSSNDIQARHSEPSFVVETSFIRAPLNSRVEGKGPSRHSSKGKARRDSLENLPLDVQEAIILEELLFVLMVGCFYLVCPKVDYVTGNSWDLYHIRPDVQLSRG